LQSSEHATPTSSRTSGTFEVQLFIRTVETPLAPRPDPAERVDWRRLGAVVAGGLAAPILVASLVMIVKSYMESH
jgi:hypothetical protein